MTCGEENPSQKGGNHLLKDIFTKKKKYASVPSDQAKHDVPEGIMTKCPKCKKIMLTKELDKNMRVCMNCDYHFPMNAKQRIESQLLHHYGVRDIVMCDSKGAIYEGRPNGMNDVKNEVAKFTNQDRKDGSLKDVIVDADVFIGVSVAGALTKEMVQSMAKDPIIFAMANPNPEIMPEDAREAGASVVGTGRSDFPNQVNNVLAFPGIFRGALDVRATHINEEMKIAAVEAIASLVSEDELSADYVIPAPFDKRVAPAVAKAVAKAAMETGVARITVDPEEVAEKTRKLTIIGE